jgi:hypothetical protein
MQSASIKRLTFLTILVTLWLDALLLGYWFDLATQRDLFWILWAASLVVFPIVVIEGRRTDSFSWLAVVGSLVPGLNLLTGLLYSYGRFKTYQTGSPGGRHGVLLFVVVLTTGLALIIGPYVFGPVALLCSVWIRKQYDRPQGALLLAASSASMLVGLLIHTLYFTFIRPGPVL